MRALWTLFSWLMFRAGSARRNNGLPFTFYTARQQSSLVFRPWHFLLSFITRNNFQQNKGCTASAISCMGQQECIKGDTVGYSWSGQIGRDVPLSLLIAGVSYCLGQHSVTVLFDSHLIFHIPCAICLECPLQKPFISVNCADLFWTTNWNHVSIIGHLSM